MEAACHDVVEEPSEANLVRLLDLWSMGWKHQVRTRVVGSGAFEKYCTLGFFGHGGVRRNRQASGLHCSEPLIEESLAEHLDLHRRALQTPHGPAS